MRNSYLCKWNRAVPTCKPKKGCEKECGKNSSCRLGPTGWGCTCNCGFFLRQGRCIPITPRQSCKFAELSELSRKCYQQGSKYRSKSDCEAKRKRKFFREKLRSEAKRKYFSFVRSEAKRTIFQNCEKLRKIAKLRKIFNSKRVF
jgi:hypothetical protein